MTLPVALSNAAPACRRMDSEHRGPVQLQGVPFVSILHLLGMPAGGLHAARRGCKLLQGTGHCVARAVQQVGAVSMHLKVEVFNPAVSGLRFAITPAGRQVGGTHIFVLLCCTACTIFSL